MSKKIFTYRTRKIEGKKEGKRVKRIYEGKKIPQQEIEGRMVVYQKI